MNRLRIGIDAHVITGKYQGTRTTVRSTLRALAQLDIDHEIIVYTDDPDEARAAIGPSNFAYRSLGHAGSIKRLLFVFPRLLRKDAIDVAVFQFITPLTSSARHVVVIHDILPITHARFFPFFNRLRVRIFFGISALRSLLVITVSEYSRRTVRDYYKLPQGKVRTVLNGSSFPAPVYAGEPVPEAPRYILAVGRIEQRKNVRLLVDAFLLARLPDVRLIVVGLPDLGYDYRFPDDPRVESRRNVDEQETIKLYRGASLFVYPSAGEGFGIPLLDALLFGIPVISSNQTAMEEIASGAATLFDPTAADAEMMLSRLIADHFHGAPIAAPTLAQRAALQARFNWDRAATDLISAIEAMEPGARAHPDTRDDLAAT